MGDSKRGSFILSFGIASGVFCFLWFIFWIVVLVMARQTSKLEDDVKAMENNTKGWSTGYCDILGVNLTKLRTSTAPSGDCQPTIFSVSSVASLKDERQDTCLEGSPVHVLRTSSSRKVKDYERWSIKVNVYPDTTSTTAVHTDVFSFGTYTRDTCYYVLEPGLPNKMVEGWPDDDRVLCYYSDDRIGQSRAGVFVDEGVQYILERTINAFKIIRMIKHIFFYLMVFFLILLLCTAFVKPDRLFTSGSAVKARRGSRTAEFRMVGETTRDSGEWFNDTRDSLETPTAPSLKGPAPPADAKKDLDDMFGL